MAAVQPLRVQDHVVVYTVGIFPLFRKYGEAVAETVPVLPEGTSKCHCPSLFQAETGIVRIKKVQFHPSGCPGDLFRLLGEVPARIG